jgi:hypothetical protein
MSNSLSFDQLIFKASHNSYDKDATLQQQLTFNPARPNDFGCIGIELDIWRNTSPYVPYESIEQDFFTVSHTRPATTPLSYYLDQVLDWNSNNPGHLPVLITLDIKSSDGGFDNFQDQIDTYLQCWFDDALIFRPNGLLKDAGKSLCQNVVENGWPTIDSDALKGKFIFCLSGNSTWKAEYATQNLPARTCFSDLDLPASNPDVYPPSTGNIVFFNFHIYEKDSSTWMNTIPPFTTSHLITRTYISNSATNWTNCIRANVSAIATDEIAGTSWCGFNGAQYQQKATTYDKRYLKNKANNEYRNNHATEMQPDYQSPECTFIFEPYKNGSETVYALRNAYNNEYLDCTITSMNRTVDGNCQKWRLIAVDTSKGEYYVQNLQNSEYLTKSASKLSDKAGTDEVYIINPVS